MNTFSSNMTTINKKDNLKSDDELSIDDSI